MSDTNDVTQNTHNLFTFSIMWVIIYNFKKRLLLEDDCLIIANNRKLKVSH